MRTLKRILFFIVVLLIAAVTLVFVLENKQPVALVFFGWSAPELSVAIPVICALLVGMLIGPLLTVFARFGRKSKSIRSA